MEATLTVRLTVRPLVEGDLEKDFVPLLQQLSTAVAVDPLFYKARLNQIMEDGNVHMLIAEDMDLHRVVGFGTVVIEPKFIHSGGLVGHLEDLVVDFGLRRKGMGSMLVRHLMEMAKDKGCYKVIIDCSESNITFYEKLNFTRKGCCMSLYFEDNQPATQLLSHEFAVKVPPSPFKEDLQFRLLEESDYDGTFLGLLRQLTTVGDVTSEQFSERAQKAREDPNTFIVVIEDTKQKKVVAAGTLFLEQKFIRNAGVAGHIEDVVVDTTVRGKGLGKGIIDFLTDVARRSGCYKVILDCDESNTGFYSKCGYSGGHSPVYMAVYF